MHQYTTAAAACPQVKSMTVLGCEVKRKGPSASPAFRVIGARRTQSIGLDGQGTLSERDLRVSQSNNEEKISKGSMT